LGQAAVNAVFRILRCQPSAITNACDALLMLPPSEIAMATPLQFRRDEPPEVRRVLATWKSKLSGGPVKRAVESALNPPANV